MGGWRGSDVKGYFREPLLIARSEMSEKREFMDKSKCKSAEIICSCFRRRDDKDVSSWVKEELVDNECRAYPTFTDSPKAFDNSSSISSLHVFSDFILNSSWVW